MYLKLINPDPKPFVAKVLETYMTIPPLGFVVVSQLVGIEVQTHYAQLEVVEATEEEYKAYRLAKDEEEKKKAEEQAKAKPVAKVEPKTGKKAKK